MIVCATKRRKAELVILEGQLASRAAVRSRICKRAQSARKGEERKEGARIRDKGERGLS